MKEVYLEILEAELVSQLVFAIVVMEFLNGVIGEVDKLILQALEVELFAGQSEVPFSEKIKVALVVDQDPYSEVEFAAIVEHRGFKVLLKHEDAIIARCTRLYDTIHSHDASLSWKLK